MAITDIWKIHSLERVSATPGASGLIGAISSVSMPVQATVTRDIDAGQIFATTGSISFSSVDLSFTSTQAAQMIDLVGGRGTCITAPAETWNIYVARYDCSGPVAGAVHRRYTVRKGMLYLTQLSCDHAGDLEVSAQLQATFDGINDPVTVADGIALPALTNVSDRWTLTGPETTTNGVGVQHKRSINVNLGVTTSTQGADSEPFDSFASIDSVLPIVTVTGGDLQWFSNLGLGAAPSDLNGKSVTHANTQIPFRKRDGAGGFIAQATAEHIVISANGPAYYDQLLSASGTDAATMSYQIHCVADVGGLNVPLTLLTAQAY